jgi:large subunit ribosomal protein L10
MALTKEKKVEVVKDLESAIKGAKSIVFVNFHKLPVKDVTVLRKSLRDQGVGYKVAKKTLIKRALGSLGTAGEYPELAGEVAIAYSKDEIAPAREVFNFTKTHKDAVSILGGVFEGKYIGKEAMLAIATIPPIQVLYGQLVGMLSSPYRSLVVALDQVAKKKA